MIGVDVSRLSQDELEILVSYANSPGARALRGMLQAQLDMTKTKLITEPSERVAGYAQALLDICAMLDTGGEELRRRRSAAVLDSAEDTDTYWTGQ